MLCRLSAAQGTYAELMFEALALASLLSLSKAEREAYYDNPAQDTLRDCADVPPRQGDCRLPPGLSAKEIEALLAGKDTAWRREGDELMVVARRDADQAFLGCAARGRMDRVADGLWALRLRVADLDRATIDISVRPSPEKTFDVLRGPQAPPAMATVAELKGKLFPEVIESKYLDDPRAVLVYLPPEADPKRLYPVVYMADGNMRTDAATFIEPLILSGKLPPMILVALWPGNSRKRGEDRRSEEYLEGWPGGTGYFLEHEMFLLKEVLPLIESKYGGSSDPKERVVTGFSSGAAWAISMGLRHPDIFPNVVAQSLIWSGGGPSDGASMSMTLQHPGQFATFTRSTGSGDFGEELARGTATRFFLSAGTLEPKFQEQTLRFADKARAAEHEVELETTVSGHTMTIWRPLLVHGLKWALRVP